MPFKLQFSSIPQVGPTLCDPMDCSKPGFPSQPINNSQSLLKLMSISSVMPSNHLILCHPLLLQASIFPESGSFSVNLFFTSGGQSIGVSASASVLQMNIQDWVPLGLIGLISLLSKGLSSLLQHHVSKASTLWHSAFLIVQLSHLYMTAGKVLALTMWNFVSKVMSPIFNKLSW